MGQNRKYLIAGNWKMNISSSDAQVLVSEIVDKIGKLKHVDVLICPPFTSLSSARSAMSAHPEIALGAQNFYPAKSGAYTGEVSAVMLRELGVTHVIIGHSERRTYFHEDDDFINKKVIFALENALLPIVCVGETLEQRKAGKAQDIIAHQIESGLRGLTKAQAQKIIIAYEPVWAIGTGETATPEMAQEMHAFIRQLLAEQFNDDIAGDIRILYGGSMKPENVKELLLENDIDGGLIGGASLKASSFCEMIATAESLHEQSV